MVAGAQGPPARRGPLWWAAVAVAVAAHLLVGLLVFASGLLAPLWAVVLLGLVWWAALALGVRWVRRGAWWFLLVPPVVLLVWFTAVSAGEALLGWTA